MQHPLYGKIVRRSTKVHAHDANGECKEGDVVRISETRPLSKTKNWRVVAVVARADDTVLETLVSNVGAKFSRSAMETVVKRAETNERLQAPVAARKDSGASMRANSAKTSASAPVGSSRSKTSYPAWKYSVARPSRCSCRRKTSPM